MIRLVPQQITSIQFTFDPIHQASRLTMKLKNEAMLQAMEAAEKAFKESGTLMGEMQFKFPRKRLPRRIKEPIEVFLKWEVIL